MEEGSENFFLLCAVHINAPVATSAHHTHRLGPLIVLEGVRLQVLFLCRGTDHLAVYRQGADILTTPVT